MSDDFDVIVIGAGPVGEHFVGRSTAAGLSTVIIESELFGGECSYWACIPSKTLLRPGRVVAEARGVPGARQAVSGPIDAAAALARRNEMVSDWHDDGQVDWVRNTGASFLRGRGRLDGERTVTVAASDGSSRRLTARRAVVIATGSSSAVPPIQGLAEAWYWDNRGATAAQVVPRPTHRPRWRTGRLRARGRRGSVSGPNRCRSSSSPSESFPAPSLSPVKPSRMRSPKMA